MNNPGFFVRFFPRYNLSEISVACRRSKKFVSFSQNPDK